MKMVSPGLAAHEARDTLRKGFIIVPFPVVSFPVTDTNIPAKEAVDNKQISRTEHAVLRISVL
jgi:hypothetical protein